MAGEITSIKILLVDNPTEIRNMREALREAGFGNVSEMTTGLQVLTEIKKNPPELVIVSFILPQYSGMQVFKSMRADKALSQIKFIMVTPKVNRRELDEIKTQGVEHILSRPFESVQLRDMIYTAFGMEAADVKAEGAKAHGEGLSLFASGSFEEALKMFRAASDAYPDAEHFFMQGRCYLEMNMYDLAIAAFQNVIERDRHHRDVDHMLGVALQKKKDYNASIQALERAARKESAKAQTHLELGKSYLGADMVEKADTSFATAVTMEPQNVEHRTEIGNAYLDKGLYEKAESAFGAALAINPENIPLYNRMAIALRKQGKFMEAINIYVKALNVAPDDEGLYYNLARALFESGQKDKAIKALDKALALDGEFKEAKQLREEYSKL
ncbi:MAG: tetratricopeptide repeat protein [Nitrospinae bacterium]|nr:tetratricopeptide repeat protein [Nitrospinota bacterium]